MRSSTVVFQVTPQSQRSCSRCDPSLFYNKVVHWPVLACVLWRLALSCSKRQAVSGAFTPLKMCEDSYVWLSSSLCRSARCLHWCLGFETMHVPSSERVGRRAASQACATSSEPAYSTTIDTEALLAPLFVLNHSLAVLICFPCIVTGSLHRHQASRSRSPQRLEAAREAGSTRLGAPAVPPRPRCLLAASVSAALDSPWMLTTALPPRPPGHLGSSTFDILPPSTPGSASAAAAAARTSSTGAAEAAVAFAAAPDTSGALAQQQQQQQAAMAPASSQLELSEEALWDDNEDQQVRPEAKNFKYQQALVFSLASATTAHKSR